MAVEKWKEKVEAKPALPMIGSDGFVINAMLAGDKTKNNVVVNGQAYHAWALDALTAYCRVTVVAYDEGFQYLKLKLQLPTRTTT